MTCRFARSLRARPAAWPGAESEYHHPNQRRSYAV